MLRCMCIEFMSALFQGRGRPRLSNETFYSGVCRASAVALALARGSRTHFNVVAVRVSHPRSNAMALLDTQTTAPSAAQKRVISIRTEAEDPVIYSGNPAELPGARYEIGEALRRAGAFKLLISHNASRLPNGTICVEHLDNVLIVTDLVNDPYTASYDYKSPCPDTPTRVARINAERAMTGQPVYNGVPNITSLPDKILKLCTVNEDEVQTEALAYALTQLSIFQDRLHANELLKLCNYDGRQLGPLLDAIEAKAKAEDVAFVTGKRNKFKESGLRGQPLTFDSFRAFFKEFNVFEYKCPPLKRTADDDLLQLVGNLFIQDPSMRKTWTEHVLSLIHI